MTPTTTTEIIAIIALVLAGSSIALLFYFIWSSSRKINVLKKQLATAEQAYSVTLETNQGLSLGAISMTDRLARIEQEFAQMHTDVERISMTEQDSRAFTQAIKLAGKGANVDELVDTCELSKGEAELIVLLHSQRQSNGDELTSDTPPLNESMI